LESSGSSTGVEQTASVKRESLPDSAVIEMDAAALGLSLDSVRDYAIFMLDPAGRVASWNRGAERITRYAAPEIIGRHFPLFSTPQDLARNWPDSLLWRAVSSGRADDDGMRVRKDGTRFWAKVVLTAIKDEQGKLRGFLKINQDVSELKRA